MSDSDEVDLPPKGRPGGRWSRARRGRCSMWWSMTIADCVGRIAARDGCWLRRLVSPGEDALDAICPPVHCRLQGADGWVLSVTHLVR